jgi:hypothetical protein
VEEDATITGDHVDEALARIESALRGLRFGTVTAIVQDGVVVQVERTERVRVSRPTRFRVDR